MLEYILAGGCRSSMVDRIETLGSLTSILRMAQQCTEGDVEASIQYVADEMECALEAMLSILTETRLKEVQDDE